MAAKVITVAQQKGGAGKTTLTAQLAVAFAGDGRRVALIDIDPQASLARWHRVRCEKPVPTVALLTLSEVAGWKLSTELDKLKQAHDLILIDSPPHAETEARVAVRCAHLVLVPVQPSPMDLWATGATIALARAAGVPILVVLNRAPSRSKIVDLTRRRLGEQELTVARAAIGNRVTFASSMLEGRSVLELSPKSMAAAEIRTLVEEIGARL
jgi:chromosome partitioning protein